MNVSRCISCMSERIIVDAHYPDWQRCLVCGAQWGPPYFPDFEQSRLKTACEKFSEVNYLMKTRESIGESPYRSDVKEDILNLLKEVSDFCLESIEEFKRY